MVICISVMQGSVHATKSELDNIYALLHLGDAVGIDMMEPLMSQRYVPLNHHPRPKFNNALSEIVLLERAPTRPLVHIPKQPFRLLDLPAEIRRLIFEQYFGHWEVTLDYERLTMLRSKFHVHGVPSVDLLLTSRLMYREARNLRMNTFNGRLNLNSVFILVPLRRKERFGWLRQNVRILHFSDSSVHPERWNRYYDNFPNLQRLEIEFPHVIGLGNGCEVLDEVLEGRRDNVLLESLDTFRLALVDQLSEMVQVTVSQRYCLKEAIGTWKGQLEVKILLARSGTRIVARNYDSGVRVVTKRQFRTPSEL